MTKHNDKGEKSLGETAQEFLASQTGNNPFAETVENTEKETPAAEEQTAAVENKEFEKLQQDYDKLNNQYIRLAADFDNFRKRQEQERETCLKYGMEQALKKMIEVLDNFDRAKKGNENISDVEKIKESFDILNKQILDSLQKLGLEIIDTQNQLFDPNYHEAVMQTPTSEYPENTIINELQKGYKYSDKVLRPSLVNVAVSE